MTELDYAMPLFPTDLLAALPSPPFDSIDIGPFSFRLYGLSIALGVLAAISIGRRRWAARGGDPDVITTIAIIGVPAGLIGARLYHVITDFNDKYSDGRWFPDAFFIWNGGLGIPGGILLGALAAIIACRFMKVPWKYVADSVAPAIPVAQAIGRLGNWFNQELYGRPTNLPWGLDVDAAPGYPADTLFHPTFLYEALWNLSLAGAIVLLGRNFVLKPGRWFAVYILGYGLGRLWVESLRIDFASEIFGLRVNTWISFLAIAGGLLWLFWGGSPLNRQATEELRSGGDPLLSSMGTPFSAVSDAELHSAASEIGSEPDEADDSVEPDESESNSADGPDGSVTS